MPLQKFQVGILILCISVLSISLAAQVSNSEHSAYELFTQHQRDSQLHPIFDTAFFLIKSPVNFSEAPEGVQIIRKLDGKHAIAKTSLDQSALEEIFPNVMLANNLWKLSPKLWQQWKEKNKGKATYLIQVEDLQAFITYLKNQNISLDLIRHFYPHQQSLMISLDSRTLRESILPSKLVYFIDIRTDMPIEERGIQGLDLGLNKISTLHRLYPNLDGSQMSVSIKENSFDPFDIDLRNREIPSDLKDKQVTTHATTMATLIGGAGNSFYNGKGVAPHALLSSSSFSNLMPDEDGYFLESKMAVQNHSYGLPIENYYGLEAMAYDQQAQRRPNLLHVFSAGNNGSETSSTGLYQEIDGFANLTGNMKMAKNILTVGSLDSLLQVPAASSKGPAFDGRVKPELVAWGADGSSGAAALTSGSILLLQQAYQRQYNSLPATGLLRAVLLNSADDLNTAGPDYQSGYGSLDILGAVQTLEKQHFLVDSIQVGIERKFTVNLPDSSIDFKITLAWTDPAASLNSNVALVNDLDLEVVGDQTGNIYLPWMLNSFPSIDSLSMPAKPGKDRLNNQEQITIATPLDSSFTITVSAHNLPVDNQAFYIAYEYQRPNQFRWLYPRSTDDIPAGEQVRLRWESTFRQEGQLWYKLVDDEAWTIVAEDVSLPTERLKWPTPDTLVQVQLKMMMGEEVFLSDTLTISQPPNLSLELNCKDKTLLTWNKVPGAITYLLYAMKAQFLEPISSVTDTFAFLDKKDSPYLEYAVAPILPNATVATKSRSINLDFQSVGCYVSNFLADLIDDRVEMQLVLGSLYELKQIQFQKYEQGQFITLTQFFAPTDLFYRTEDLKLRDGVNIYRVVIILQDGTSIISDEVSLLYTSRDFLVFPNPINRLDGINIIAKETENVQFLLFDNLGRLVVQQDLLSPFEEVISKPFTPGLYHYMILQEKERRAAGKILIR